MILAQNNLASLSTIETTLQISFAIAFLIVLIRFVRDLLFYKIDFKTALLKRQQSLIVIVLMYIIVMMTIFLFK